jgi:hypothetical protein
MTCMRVGGHILSVPMGDERDGGSGFDGSGSGVGLGLGWGSGLDG